MGELKIAKTGKQKHSHLLTNILKFTIFACVMLAPFFSVLSKCLYVACNKNAKDSYYGETINQNVQIIGYNDLSTDYYYLFNEATVDSGNIAYSVNNVSIAGGTFTFQQDVSLIKELFIYYSSGIHYTRIQFQDNTYQYVQNLQSQFNNLVLNFYLNNKPVNTAFADFIYYRTYNNYSYLDNVFIYSVAMLENERIFNWTTNTGIYTAVNSMTTGLGFTGNSNIIALLLSYWAINTAVYIIFDIVIWCFTKLTHFLND